MDLVYLFRPIMHGKRIYRTLQLVRFRLLQNIMVSLLEKSLCALNMKYIHVESFPAIEQGGRQYAWKVVLRGFGTHDFAADQDGRAVPLHDRLSARAG